MDYGLTGIVITTDVVEIPFCLTGEKLLEYLNLPMMVVLPFTIEHVLT